MPIENSTTLQNGRRVLVEVGGLPHLRRLSRSDHEDIRRNASYALREIGHKNRSKKSAVEAMDGGHESDSVDDEV